MRLTITLAAFATTMATHATIHTVTCQNGASHFLPVTVNAVVGDTIYWTWVSGTHIVGPINVTDIPAGALMWDVPIDAAHLDFEYVVPVPGNYNYVCHPDAPHGEDGFIVVSSATSVSGPDRVDGPFAFYPNPFSETLTVEVSGATGIAIYDALGGNVMSHALKSGTTKLQFDLATLPKGVYFYRILRNGVVLETRRVVKY